MTAFYREMTPVVRKRNEAMYISYLLAKTIQNDHLREADQERLARKLARIKKAIKKSR